MKLIFLNYPAIIYRGQTRIGIFFFFKVSFINFRILGGQKKTNIHTRRKTSVVSKHKWPYV